MAYFTRCYLCGNHSEIGDNEIDICGYCRESEPALTKGFQAVRDIHFTTQLEPFISGVNWFDYRKLAARHNGKSFQRERNPPIEVEKAVEVLSEQIGKVGQKPALTFFHLFHAMGTIWAQSDHLQSEAGFPAETIEMGLGLAVSSHIKETPSKSLLDYYPDPSGVYGTPGEPANLDEVYGLDVYALIDFLGIFLKAYNNLDQGREDFDPLEDMNRVRASVRRSKISSDTNLPPEFSIDVMDRLYSPFTMTLMEKFGFETRDVRRYAESMLEFFYYRRRLLYQALRWYEADCFRVIGSYWRHSDEITPEDFSESIPGRERLYAEKMSWAYVLYMAEKCLWFDSEELRKWAGIRNKRRFDVFIDRISVSVGEKEFSDVFEHLNPLEECPLVEYEGEYLVPNPTRFADSLMNTFYYDLLNFEETVGGDMTQIWGEVIEYWVTDSIERIFPDTDVLTNVYLGDLETDGLLRYEDTLLIVEAKSKQLTKGAYRGDPNAIKEDFSKGIGGVTDQLTERVTYCRNADEDLFEQEIGIDLGPVENYLPIGVMGTTYEELGTTEYVRLLDNQLTPYVLSAHHLDLVSEVLDSPEQFIQYVKERVEANGKGLFRSADELDFLGYFVQKGTLTPTFKETEKLAETDHTELVNSIGGFRSEVEDQLFSDENYVNIRWLEDI